MGRELYTDGRYATKHPAWHVEDASWKAAHILRIITDNDLGPRSICEVGCGAGELLRDVRDGLGADVRAVGYEISPQAYELCREREDHRLHFEFGDITTKRDDSSYDVLLLIDVIEHVEDYYTLLRSAKRMGEYNILHIPLDLSTLSVWRHTPIRYAREHFGHIHYFSKDTALDLLQDLDYEVIDSFYTPLHDAPSVSTARSTLLGTAARLIRKLLFRLNEDMAVRLLGGYSLMVLAR